METPAGLLMVPFLGAIDFGGVERFEYSRCVWFNLRSTRTHVKALKGWISAPMADAVTHPYLISNHADLSCSVGVLLFWGKPF